MVQNHPQLCSPTSPTSTSVTFTSSTHQPSSTEIKQLVPKKSVIIDTTNENYESRIKTLKRKYSMASSKTSKSKTTATTTKSALINVRLCCGTFAFNLMKIISILGMFIIIASFLTIFIVTIQTYEIVKWPLVETLQHYGNSYKYYNSMIMAEYIAVFGRNETYANEYVSAKKSLISTMNRLFALVPTASLTNMSISDASEIPLFKLQQEVVDFVVAKNYSAALTYFYKPTHYNGMYSFLNTYVNFVGEIKNMSVVQLKAMDTATTTDLTVIAVCLSVAIPLVILIFINAIKNEHDSAKKLEHTNAIMVIQTISDPFMRPLFEQYCKEGSQSNRFRFLEQVQLFKENKRSLHSTIRSILEDMKQFSNTNIESNSPHDEEDDQSEVLTFSSDLFSTASFKSTDREERKANDIYSEFLDPDQSTHFVKYSKHLNIKREIEQYQLKNANNLVEGSDNDFSNIFDQAQIVIAKKLIKTHQSFKSSMNFPTKSKADMLDSFRVDYLKLMKQVEGSNKKSFRNIVSNMTEK